jgi:GT2 family glycosyltransferase
MPVYNGAAYLRESIESILSQSFADFEFIAVDDGSTDASGTILAEYAAKDRRLRVARNDRNLGLAPALNRGLSMARGVWVARQDGDDISLPDRLARQTAFMREHPDVGVSGSQMIMFNERGRVVGEYRVGCTHGMILWNIFFGWVFAHPTVIMRRDVLSAAGGYDPQCFGEDVDLWVRLAERTRFANLPEALVRYRRHGNAYSLRGRSRQQADALRARQRFASRLLGREVPESVLLQAGRAQAEDMSLTEAEIRGAVGLTVDLFLALISSGRVDEADVPAIRRDMVERVVLLSRGSREVAGLVPRLQALQRAWRKATPQPVKAVVHALRRAGSSLGRGAQPRKGNG